MSAESNAAIIATYETLQLGDDASIATIALVCYEHIITIKYEVDFLLRRKWSAATWIFVFNRYLLLASVIAPFTPITAQLILERRCKNAHSMFALSFFILGTVQSLPNHVFTTLRVYGLLKGYSWKFAVTSVVVLITLLVLTWDMYEDGTKVWSFIDDPRLGSTCFQSGISTPLNIERRTSHLAIYSVSQAIAVLAVFSAMIVIGVTLMKTVHQVRQASSLGITTSFSATLLRDGSLFFFLILLEDLLLAIPATDGDLFDGPAGYFTAPLFSTVPYILLSRFLINLRQAESTTGSSLDEARTAHGLSTPNFRMPTMDAVIGNLGESMDFEDHFLDDDDENEQLSLRVEGSGEDSTHVGKCVQMSRCG